MASSTENAIVLEVGRKWELKPQRFDLRSGFREIVEGLKQSYLSLVPACFSESLGGHPCLCLSLDYYSKQREWKVLIQPAIFFTFAIALHTFA
jgi:hypothetical protein